MGCRSPHGERGLKFYHAVVSGIVWLSLPAWGAWIEIRRCSGTASQHASLPAWGAWIEILR